MVNVAGVGAARGGSTREHGDGGGKQEQHLGVLLEAVV